MVQTMNNPVSIAVIGSINLDIVARVREFPLPGETVTNADVIRCPGGKGANQALAAHRLGASVFMVGRVGNDPMANEALYNLRTEGVDLSYCKPLDDLATGLALILVNHAGENQIVVAPGANARFDAQQLDLPLTDAYIAQLEVPIPTILKAARNHKNFFCLNAAPVKPVPHELLQHVDLLVVNEIEALALGEELEFYDGLLASTFGARGAVLSHKGVEIARAMPPEVKVIDTTGAGDAFTAALTTGLVNGMKPSDALQFACVAGALATTGMGAQSSPTQKEVQQLT